MRRLDRTPSSHATNATAFIVLYPKNCCAKAASGGGALQRELSRAAALLENMHPPSPPAISPFASMGQQQPAVLPLCLDKSTGWCPSALSILRLRGGCRTLTIESRGRERYRLTTILLTLVKAGRENNMHTTPTTMLQTLTIENKRAMNMCRLPMTNLVYRATTP